MVKKEGVWKMDRIEQVKKAMEIIDQHIKELTELKHEYQKKLADAQLTLDLLK